jgi:hypothetical protein
MALPLVLVLLMALTFFGHAALVLSQREVQASAAFRDLARAEKAAGVGLRMAFSLPVDPMAERPLWIPQSLLAGEVMDGLTYSATRRWIDGEFFVVLGRGGVMGWPGEKEVGWVGWALHAGIRLSSFLAAAEVGVGVNVHERSSVSSEGFFSVPEGWPPEAGAEIGRRAKDIYSAGPLPAVAHSVTIPSTAEDHAIGLFGASPQESSRIPGLGLLSGAEILRRVGKSGGAWPRQIQEDGHGCPGSGEMPVSLGVPGSLSLPGGRSCGLVVTEGDLKVGAGTFFQGLALVGGDLIIESMGILEGLARIGGHLILEEGGEFRGSSIPAVWALEGANELHNPLSIRLDSTWGW